MSSLSNALRLVALGLLLLPARSHTAGSQIFCTVCHSEVDVLFRDSAHFAEDLTCTSCHGGNASATEIESAHGEGFRGPPTRAEIPGFCAGCHAEPEQMRPYGIPTDQYALYLTSRHGRGFAEGNTQVAICTDCHGSHRILASSAPENPTGRLNISATCGQCHADQEMMAPYGIAADVVGEYEGSVHAEALRRRGDPQAPDCSRCHGSHGAAPPGAGDVNKVCGQCHRHTRDAFRHSPHLAAAAATGQGDCAACHGSHRILSPDSQMWASSCTPCHDASSEAARTGDSILALFTQAEEEVEHARHALVQASEIPLDVSDYEMRLNTAATHLVEARPLSHSLDLASIEELTRKARSIAQEVQAEVHEKVLVFESRDLVAIFVWLYILITIVAIQYYKRAGR